MRPPDILRFFLRVNAIVCGLAIIPAIMPLHWMDITHRWLGLGPLPDGPVFEYLARSISLLYVGMGAFAYLLSRDVARYAVLIRWYGAGHIFFGAMLFWIDKRSKLPDWWARGEGPFVMLVGLLVLLIALRCGQDNRT